MLDFYSKYRSCISGQYFFGYNLSKKVIPQFFDRILEIFSQKLVMRIGIIYLEYDAFKRQKEIEKMYPLKS